MPDFIDRHAAMNVVGLTTDAIKIDPIETKYVDAQGNELVAVVRCKDCKWGTPHPEGDEYTKCFKLCTTFFSGHYCAWGERREDVETDCL